jgi:hypothetical protein
MKRSSDTPNGEAAAGRGKCVIKSKSTNDGVGQFE